MKNFVIVIFLIIILCLVVLYFQRKKGKMSPLVCWILIISFILMLLMINFFEIRNYSGIGEFNPEFDALRP